MAWLSFQELWCCGRRAPGPAAQSKFGPLALETPQPTLTQEDRVSTTVYTPPPAPEYTTTPPVARQSWINATIEQEVDLSENTRRKTRTGTVSNVVAFTATPQQAGRTTVVSTSTLGVPASTIRGSLPQQQCDDFGIGPQVLVIPDDVPARQSTRSELAAPAFLQETVEELRPDTRRKSLTGRSVSFSDLVSSEPPRYPSSNSGAQVSGDFGILQVEEKVEVLNQGVRRTTRKSTVSSVQSLQAIREEPVVRTSGSGGDFGIQLNSSEEVMRELQNLERQVEVLARKEKEHRLTTIKYQVKAKAPEERRRSSAPGILLGSSDASKTELSQKRERARTTLRYADKNGGGVNFAELAALAAAEDSDEDEEGDDDEDEIEKTKMAAAMRSRVHTVQHSSAEMASRDFETEKAKMAAAMRSRVHTVQHSTAEKASRDFDARRRFQTIGPGSASSLKRGSISGPINPFSSGLQVGRRHTTYSAPKTSRELAEILKLVPLKKVQVIESHIEWDAGDDDENEQASAEQLYEHAQSKSLEREKRLTFACTALKQEEPLGDAELHVVEAKKEWDGDDSDEEVNGNKFEESVISQRETRRTMAQGELMKDLALADAEVEVVAETGEWAAGDGDSDDDLDQTKQAAVIRDAREKRLTIAEAVLQLDHVIADAEVEVQEEDREWSGGGDFDDEKDGIPREKAAASAFQTREKRLTVALGELEKDGQLADAEVSVKTEEKEWLGDDSDEDIDGTAGEEQRKRRNSASFSAREKRLTIATEELKKDLIVADVELEVKEEVKEWDADAESDEDIDAVRDKRNAQSFETREKRLTMAGTILENAEILGDAEMVVNEEAKEWIDGGDSDEERSFDQVATRASVRYQAREQRISISQEVLSENAPVNGNI